MPTQSQVRFVTESLRRLVETLYLNQEISRETRLAFERVLHKQKQMALITAHLYGPQREFDIPSEEEPGRKLVLLSLKEIGTGRFPLLAIKRKNSNPTGEHQLRCLVGHRFTKSIEQRIRWNLRHLFELFNIQEDYSGFDGLAVNIIEDLREKIRQYDFCLFDNRETTNPSKPNVYIEAGMALALSRPFIFCHYRREVWPSDFSNTFYVSYRNYKELFTTLYATLPVFIKQKLQTPKASS